MWNVRSPQRAQRRCVLQMQLVSRRGPGGRTCRAMAHARGVWAVHTLHWRTRGACGPCTHCTGACARRASGAVVWRGSRVSRPSPRGSIEPAGGTPVTPHLASSCGCGRMCENQPGYSFIYGCSLYVRGVVPRRRPRRARAATWHVQQQQHHGVTRVSPHSRRELFPLSPRF